MSLVRLTLTAIALCLAAPAAAQSSPEEIARAALAAAPVWDGHNDVPGRLRGMYRNVLAGFDFNDTLEGEAWTPG